MKFNGTEINIGDRLTFKSPTRSGARKATRLVSGFADYPEPWGECVTVNRFEGWSNFVVKQSEIIGTEPKNQ